jgi:hypothetical protein
MPVIAPGWAAARRKTASASSGNRSGFAQLRRIASPTARKSRAQQGFGQAGKLEEHRVPGAAKLLPRPEDRLRCRRVRHVHDHEAIQWSDLPHGEVPGDDRSPIVADQGDRGRPGSVDQGTDVAQQLLDRVVLHMRRLGRLAVAAQVRRPHAVAQIGEHRHLMPPGVPALGKAVQAECQALSRSAGRDAKAQLSRLDELVTNRSTHDLGSKTP